MRRCFVFIIAVVVAFKEGSEADFRAEPQEEIITENRYLCSERLKFYLIH